MVERGGGFTLDRREITATTKHFLFPFFFWPCASGQQVERSSNNTGRPGTVILIISEGVKPIIFSASRLGVQRKGRNGKKISHLISLVSFFFYVMRTRQLLGNTQTRTEKKRLTNFTYKKKKRPVDYLQYGGLCAIVAGQYAIRCGPSLQLFQLSLYSLCPLY